MLTATYFQFFTDVDALNQCIHVNYKKAIEDDHFFYGSAGFIPSSYDMLYDRKQHQLRENAHALIYRAMEQNLRRKNPDLALRLGVTSVEWDLICMDALEYAKENLYFDMSKDVQTLLYMNGMSFREDRTICNPAIMEVW